ncbi:MAG: hypothetical protein BWY95_00078 [Bacteroidetes bacterium ADurb.BinA104]|jgi:hypothetical protein|nr:MAG: hypothetical protein BWY95_00078 [Bacteroidetes bacterium ADurb.BinA104]
MPVAYFSGLIFNFTETRLNENFVHEDGDGTKFNFYVT